MGRRAFFHLSSNYLLGNGGFDSTLDDLLDGVLNGVAVNLLGAASSGLNSHGVSGGLFSGLVVVAGHETEHTGNSQSE